MTHNSTFAGRRLTRLPLLDRQAELAVLERAVEEVVAGEGRVVLLEGGPGAGKTRLLAEARAIAERAGLRVFFARGGEMEREHPYGVVRQLFEGALLRPDGAPWLEGPAAAARSVFVPETTVDAAPFATLNGLYWLMVNATVAQPLVVAVDDLHWVDSPSLGFLQFLVRRLEGLPVLLVMAGRPGETDALADIAASPAADVLRPAPLSEGAAVRLTQDLLGVRPAERFVAACHRATGGNPMLLVELLRALRAEGITPDDAHVDAVGDIGPSAVSRVVLVRLRRLPEHAVAVAQAIAVLGTGAEGSLLAALAQEEEVGVARAIEALIEAEIVDAQPPLGFVHPIIREAIYRELPPDERDRRHARAAELLRARAAEPDQVGAHLLLAAPRGATWVVETLQAAAADAAQRGAIEIAITFLRRALAERPGEPDFDLLFRLGMSEAAVDPHAAVRALRAARRVAPDSDTRVRIGEMITRILVFFDPLAAIESARQTRAELPPGAVDERAALLAIEIHAGRFHAASAEPYIEDVPDSARGRMLKAVRVWNRALSGGTAAECAALAAEVLGLDDTAGRRPSFSSDATFTTMIAGAILIFADDPRAQIFWDTWYDEAVRAGRAHVLIAGGVWQGLRRFRLGQLAEAEAAIRGAMEGSRAWGPGTDTIPAHTLANLADILIERGDLDGAQAALDRVPPNLGPESEGALQSRGATLALLTARGRHQEALDAVEPVLDRLQTVRNPAWRPWRSLRANALAHLGRTDEAIAAVTEELELARHWGTPGPIGRAQTHLGILEQRLDLLEGAVEITRDPFARLEHAHALLALGEHIRRGRRPNEARPFLRDAHDVAVRCQADALARRARNELAAAGGRPRATAGSGADSLTPSERRVAELAGAGFSNRDIAQQLYLSVKTIEVHLTNSYRKLGIRTRAELGPALGA